MDEIDRACGLIKRGVEIYLKATLEGLTEALGGAFKSITDFWRVAAQALAVWEYKNVVRRGIQALEEGRLGVDDYEQEV